MTAWTRQVRMAEEELRFFLRALPAELARKTRAIEVVFERRPSAALIADGLDPDLMGLFEGPSLSEPEGEGVVRPPRILLFLDNIWEETGGEENIYREEVRLTLAHELGHYLGLDESGLIERDIE